MPRTKVSAGDPASGRIWPGRNIGVPISGAGPIKGAGTMARPTLDASFSAERRNLLNRPFEQADVNRDGFLNAMEFKYAPGLPGGSSRDLYFRHADRNRDGKLSRREWLDLWR